MQIYFSVESDLLFLGCHYHKDKYIYVYIPPESPGESGYYSFSFPSIGPALDYFLYTSSQLTVQGCIADCSQQVRHALLVERNKGVSPTLSGDTYFGFLTCDI